MKAFLVNPPFQGRSIERRNRCTRVEPSGWVHPPIGLLYLASVLQEKGVEVKFMDAVVENLAIDDVVRSCSDFEPDFIISWTGSFSYAVDIKTLAAIKKILPKVKNLLVGSDITAACPELLLDHCFIDFVVVGEAELTVADFVDYLQDKIPLGSVRNLAYRKGGKDKFTKKGVVSDIDSLPFPDRSLIDTDAYHAFPFFHGKFTDIMTSRGCIYNCTFCTAKTYWGRYRRRSNGNILAELKECVDKYGINQFYINDDLFTFDKKNAIALCDAISSELPGIRWACQTRVDTVDDDTLAAMARAGCIYIHYGVESGSQKLLDYFNKGITVGQIEMAFELTKKHGIEASATVIVGTPEDTWEDFDATLSLLKRIDPDYVHVSPLIPIPGSELFKKLDDEGLLKHKDFEKYVKPNICFKPKYLTEDEIRDEYRRMWKYTMRPSYLARRFYRMLRRGDFAMARESLKAGSWVLGTFFKKGQP